MITQVVARFPDQGLRQHVADHERAKAILLIPGTREVDPGHQRELQWGLANDQIGYMEAVLSDMLTFARPEEPNFDWQDMTSILNAAAISVELKAADKNVEIGPVALACGLGRPYAIDSPVSQSDRKRCSGD